MLIGLYKKPYNPAYFIAEIDLHFKIYLKLWIIKFHIIFPFIVFPIFSKNHF